MDRLSAGRIVRLTAIVATLLSVSDAVAQKPAGNRATDEAAVRQAGKDYLAALERGDAKTLADCWTADGVYVDDTGKSFKARDLIAKRGDSAQAARRLPTRISNVSVRFVTPDVAIEEGACEMLNGGNSPPVSGHFTAIWVRQQNKWKLDNLCDWQIKTGHNREGLEALDLLAGNWTGTLGQTTIRVSAQWNAGKTFLTRQLYLTSDGKESPSGTQQIGWDSGSRQIKSWVFNNDGSRGEGIWNLEGNAWMIEATSHLRDGRTSTATHVFKFKDKNTLVWKSIGGELDGQPIPDSEVTFTRLSAKK